MGKRIAIPLGIVGASLGMGILGNNIKPINNSIGTNIQKAGEGAGKFIGPAVNISMGSAVIKQLKDLKEGKKNALL